MTRITVSQVNSGQSIQCSNIQEVNCSNDQFLQLHEIYPEQISRVKASFHPFIHPQQVNIAQLIADANAKNFVSYYILSGIAKYNESVATFKVNDRIVLINANNQIENVKLHSVAGLENFPDDAGVNIGVKGLTLDEMLDKNKSIKRKSTKSNNVARIQSIKKAITGNGIYKFKTFFSYYDGLFNKRVYSDGGSDSSIETITLQASETVFKVSMSPTAINEEAFTYFNERNLIVVHGETKAKARSSQTQGDAFSKEMKVGDYFYLCRGNINLEVIGRITGDAEKCGYNDFGANGWLQRPYDVIADAANEEAYQGDTKWWTPNDNSTCIAIPQSDINDANQKIVDCQDF